MTINVKSLNRVNFEDLKAACQAPTSDMGVMDARVKCVYALIDQEIEDYTAVIERLIGNQADTDEFTRTVAMRLYELQDIKRAYGGMIDAIDKEECDDEDMQELKIGHKQTAIAEAFDDLQAGVMLRGLSTWHSDELWSSNMEYKHTASPYSEHLSTVIQAYDSEYVRAVAFRMYA